MAASDEEAVLQVIDKFSKAFNTLDSDLMASLWWNSPKTSSFGPQKSEAFLTEGGQTEANHLKAFFEYLKSSRASYAVSPHHVEVTMLGDNGAVVTSYSTATLTVSESGEQAVELDRGTFVLQKTGGKWLIVHCHVSGLPTE